MTKKIYAFAGRKRAGKGVLCNIISENNDVKIITIANYLKYLCCELLNCDYETLNKMKDDGTTFNKSLSKSWMNIIHKETNISKFNIINELGYIKFTSVRQMLQVIGTDLIRKYSPNWHVSKMLNDIKNCEKEIICIDDVRFPNEKFAIENIGGKCFFVIRKNCMNVSNHISERSLFWHDFDYDKVILNSKDINYLHDSFLKLFNSDFKIDDNKLLLASNKQFLDKSCNLGKENDEITKRIIINAIDSYSFNYEGKVITKLPFIKEIKDKYGLEPNEKGYFEIDNPCIIENLKQWI